MGDLSHCCIEYNGSILLMGGQGEGEQPLDSGEIYNPTSDQWTPTPTRLTRAKRGLSMATLGGVVFACGGEDRNDDNLQTVMMLDSRTGAWVEWHPMSSRRAGHAVGVIRREQLPGRWEELEDSLEEWEAVVWEDLPSHSLPRLTPSKSSFISTQ